MKNLSQATDILLHATDLEISMLAKCQQKVALLYREGYTLKEITKMLQRTSTYGTQVAIQAAGAIIRIRRGNLSSYNARKKRDRNEHFIDYSKYRECDLSVLSNTEKAVLEIKISNPSIPTLEISHILGISYSSVRMSLSNSIKKLDGRFDDTKDYRKKYREEHKEHYREYNKKYRKEHKKT